MRAPRLQLPHSGYNAGLMSAPPLTVAEPSSETISITLPNDARYASVARIVVGGLAARLSVSYESLDDLQLAVETLLAENELIPADHVTLDLTVGDGSLSIELAPIDPRAASAALQGGGDPLRMVLAAVVDETIVDERRSALRLRKDLPTLQRD